MEIPNVLNYFDRRGLDVDRLLAVEDPKEIIIPWQLDRRLFGIEVAKRKHELLDMNTMPVIKTTLEYDAFNREIEFLTKIPEVADLIEKLFGHSFICYPENDIDFVLPTLDDLYTQYEMIDYRDKFGRQAIFFGETVGGVPNGYGLSQHSNENLGMQVH